MVRPLPVCLGVLTVLVALFASSPPSGLAHAEGTSLKSTLALAKEAHAAGKLERAEYFYRKAVFAKGGSKARKGLSRVTKERANFLFERAETNLEKDPYYATIDLEVAAKIAPKDKRLAKLFPQLGYEQHLGEWIHKDRAAAFQALNAEGGVKRREELGLNPTFEVIVQGPFRFLTNVDLRGAKSVLQQALNTNHSHYRVYRDVMGAFGLRFASESIDVVLFDTREQYVRYTKHSGSAGLYIPARRSGFFFRDGSFNFPTMLHEMTHQLNDKLLQGRSHAWFEEGISEYFGAAMLTQGGKRIQVGRPDGGRMATFQKTVRGIEGNYIPLEDFVTRGEAELTGEFYSQSWALAHFLMEVHPRGRLILFDYVAGVSPTGRLIERRSGNLGDVLTEYEITLKTFETEFREFYRTGKYSSADS